MTDTEFVNRKDVLLKDLKEYSAFKKLTQSEEESVTLLKEILINEYTLENRMKVKGLLSRVIVDSVDLPYDFTEKFIVFDQNL